MESSWYVENSRFSLSLGWLVRSATEVLSLGVLDWSLSTGFEGLSMKGSGLSIWFETSGLILRIHTDGS